MLIDSKTSTQLIEHLGRVGGNLDSRDHKLLLNDNQELLIKLRRLNEDAIRDGHPTEEKYPEMCDRFQEIQKQMYQVFLDKNMDYSPYNINGTGIVGLCTRFWDKTARIMHLIGFDIGTGIYTGIRKNTVEDEPIEKTFIDGSNYGIIARIWLEGKWGK